MFQRRRISLGGVLFLLVLATTVPLGLFAAGLIGATWRQQQQQVDRQNIEVVRAISLAVDQEFERTVAALTVLGSLVPADPSRLHDFYDLSLQTVPMQDWQSLRLVSPSGSVLMSTEMPYGAAPSLLNADWVHEAVASGQPSFSTARQDPALGHWVVNVGLPIRRGGVVRYVLAARILTSTFTDILQQQSAPASGLVSLMDQQPKLVARTRSEAAFAGREPSPEFRAEMQQDPDGARRTTTLDGIPSYSAWSRSAKTGWTAVVALPAAVVDGPIRKSLYALIMGATSVLGLGLVAAVYVRKRLVDSERAAGNAARALARGEPVTPPDSAIAEIQDLSTALRDAAGILETRLRERDEAQQEAERQRSALLEREVAGRRAAEALSRAKDEFVATVSHELRTPLNAIYGWVSLLRTAPFDAARQKQGLEVIHRNTVAQLTLIDDLLDMSRVIRGTVRLDMQPVDLAVALDAAIDALKPAADARRIAVHVDAERGAALVSADQSRLQQIVFNVLSNSLKFTPQDGRIDITLRVEHDEAVVAITDTGEGIAPEFLPHVFDRFRQEASDATRPHAGLGIGLSLVRHLTELHGGTIEAASQGKGCGATFTIKLPLLGSGASAVPAPSPAAHDGRSRSIVGLRVLVVDDEADARELLATVLREAGADAVMASSTAEALAVLDSGLPHAVISDIAMPTSSGYELARTLHGDPRTSGIPLIAVTAYSRGEDRERALAAGFDAHVGKPFDPRALVGLIGALVAENV